MFLNYRRWPELKGNVKQSFLIRKKLKYTKYIHLERSMKEFEEKFDVKYSVPLKQYNYQHIIDISTVKVASKINRFVYFVYISISETETYEIKNLIPVPKKINSVFLAIIPNYDYLLMGQGHITYALNDKISLDKCRLYGLTNMCKRIQLTYLFSETHS